MFTLLVFIAVLAVLVLSHEWGHFIIARKHGIKVSEFGFGFPPRLFGFRRLKNQKRWQFVWRNRDANPGSATLYSLNLIPLGGFVKIKGEDAGRVEANDPDSFANKKPWQKASVLVAGVAMNVFVAFMMLSAGYMIGLPETRNPNETPLPNSVLQIVEVLPGKPAQAAGLLAGDVITKIDNLEQPQVKELQRYIDAHKNNDITVVVLRSGESVTKTIHPIVYPDTGKGGLGVALAEVATVRYPWYQALYHGAIATWFYLQAIVLGFGLLLKDIFTGQGVGSAVSGPIGVAIVTGQAARLGVVYLLQFMAVLSLNLAVLNILPIPALDGGRLLFVIINKLKKRPIAPAFEQLAHTISFVALMALVVVITVQDVRTFAGVFQNWFSNI